MTDYNICLSFLSFVLGFIIGGGLFSALIKFREGRHKKGNTKKKKMELQKKAVTLPKPDIPKRRIIDCPDCDGIGKVEEKVSSFIKGAPLSIGLKEKWVTCETCKGSGRVYERCSQ